MSFIPYVGSAILLYFLVQPTKEDSPYREDKVNLPLQVNSLSKCVDYTLEEVSENDVPHEAIRIAEILGVNEALMTECKQFLNNTK